MLRHIQRIAVACIAIVAISTALPAAAGPIAIEAPSAMVQSDTSKPGGVSLTIVNSGDADTLVSISTPVAKVAQLYNNKMKRGKMRMRRKSTVDIAAKAKLTLTLEGLHIMLMGLTTPMNSGMTFPITLNFEKAGAIEVKVTVR